MQSPTDVEWDEVNEAAHVEKHGVPFGIAARVFGDARRTEKEDVRPNRLNERRWNSVGVVDGRCINVTFAIDGPIARIISARPAHRKERKSYGYRPETSRGPEGESAEADGQTKRAPGRDDAG